ncbi:MAG: hypothetical protein LBT23_11605 [Synergistaceae bacterium]|nr:hypothetical protein [Synergistaceae bacterium]
MFSSTAWLEKYADPYSDYNVEREVRKSVAWLEYIMRRSMMLREDMTLRVRGVKTMSMEAKRGWSEWESWTAGNIYFLSIVGSGAVGSSYEHSFSYSFQTLTPALTIYIFTGERGTRNSGWSITISARGLVRAEKTM